MLINMRKNLGLAALIIGCLFLPSVAAVAQNTNATAVAPLKVAILDLGSIRRQALVVKNVREQLSKYQAGFRESIQKEDAALKAANQELSKKRTLLAPEAFAQERRQFEQKVVATQKLVQASKVALDQVQAKAMVEVEKTLNGIITKIAEKNGINLILRRDVTILASRSFEITGEVLKELDKQMPTVKVDKPVLK